MTFYFAYMGNKRTDIKFFSDYLPYGYKIINTVVEPFCGSCSVSRYYYKDYKKIKYHVNDIDTDLINFLNYIKKNTAEPLIKIYNEKIGNDHPEKLKLDRMFKKYNPTFEYKESHHYTDDIIDFVFESNTDILALVPKEHGLIETIFNDHTKKLAFHSKVPLLILH